MKSSKYMQTLPFTRNSIFNIYGIYLYLKVYRRASVLPSHSDRIVYCARSKAELARLFTHLPYGRLNIVHTKNQARKAFIYTCTLYVVYRV